jgi:hypothetical protein
VPNQNPGFRTLGLRVGRFAGAACTILLVFGMSSTGHGNVVPTRRRGDLLLPTTPAESGPANNLLDATLRTPSPSSAGSFSISAKGRWASDTRLLRRGEDDHWYDGFDLPPTGQGIDGGDDIHVNVLFPFQGELIAAGEFTMAGGNSCNNIASWDGSAWHPLGSGLPGVVLAMAEYRGDLIVGGDFPSYGYLARWDGTSWTTLGGGADDQIWSLAVWNDSLIAGGRFSVVGGQPARCVARWDGSSWRALGAGFTCPGQIPAVYALTVYEGELIAGGLVSLSDDVPVGRAARWTGSVWTPMGSPTAWDAWGSVGEFAAYDGALYACGDFLYNSPDGPNFVARYDGSTWVSLGVGTDFWVSSMVVHESSLFMGGGFSMAGGESAVGVARWDGSSWSSLGAGVNDYVNDLTVAGGHLYTGGWFTTAGAKPSYRIARWDSVDPTAVDENVAGFPTPASLDLRGPNPFRQSLRIVCNLAQPGAVQIRVFDLAGREVRTLLDGYCLAGRSELDWEGRNADGRMLPAGVYTVQLRSGGATRAMKAVLVR